VSQETAKSDRPPEPEHAEVFNPAPPTPEAQAREAAKLERFAREGKWTGISGVLVWALSFFLSRSRFAAVPNLWAIATSLSFVACSLLSYSLFRKVVLYVMLRCSLAKLAFAFLFVGLSAFQTLDLLTNR